MAQTSEAGAGLAWISSYNSKTPVLRSGIFRRAAHKLEIQDRSSPEANRLAAIISTMRCGDDDIDKLAENASNLFRADAARRAGLRAFALKSHDDLMTSEGS